MENVILVVHLILALCLIGIVLLQRSEGGGLGMGGGGDVMTGRAAATALGKMTWIFAIGFIATSITLTVLARKEAASSSVMDGVAVEEVERPDQQRLPGVAVKERLQRLLVLQPEDQEGSEIVAVAPAVAIGLGQADITLGRRRRHGAPVADGQVRRRPRLAPLEVPDLAVRRGQSEASILDLVETTQQLAFNLAFKHRAPHPLSLPNLAARAVLVSR